MRNGVPSGLADQLGEVSAVLNSYDAAVTKIEKDTHLTPAGRASQIKDARDAALAAVQQWKASRTSGIDAQAAVTRAALQTKADQALPAPSATQVANMAQRLSGFNPLEVELLYADATDSERRVIEAAAEGSAEPRRVASPGGEQIVREHLLAPERIAAVREARLEQVNPEGAAALRDFKQFAAPTMRWQGRRLACCGARKPDPPQTSPAARGLRGCGRWPLALWPGCALWRPTGRLHWQGRATGT